MLKQYGFLRVGAVSNKVEVGNVCANVEEILKCLDKANSNGVEIVTFPELSLTGYTCQDLFLNSDLLNDVLEGIEQLKKESLKYDLVFIVGAPLVVNDALYNCAISISKGKVIGITPKTYIPNYNEFYEARYFNSGADLTVNEITLNGEIVPISNMLIYKCDNYNFISYAIDICEDLFVSNSPSNYTSLLGANIIFNLSSSNEIVGKKQYRKDLVRVQSAKSLVAYVYASSGVSESSSDLCFSGHLIISEPNGKVIENNRFSFESDMIYTDVDLLRINNDRLKNRTFKQLNLDITKHEAKFELSIKDNELVKQYTKTPFLSHDEEALEEILNIQTYGLARRIKHLNKSKMVIGISGGSDSTLAFLVCLRVIKVLNMNPEDIVAVTMPGFGTSNKTYTNALNLIKASGVTLKEISIVDACKQHYKDIGHKEDDYNVTYENAQARERTQILFDLANDLNGIVIGTGDLSELVLGWATYNGDHMSNYGVNASIPKTLVISLIRKIKDDSKGVIKETLEDILNTPISPELLPLDSNGNIIQDSQKSIGPYKLHDFFIYHFLRYGASVKKIYYLACLTFKDEYSKEEIKATLTIFIKRFFTQQFKRNCLPDGVKVGSVSVSPRGDLRLSSDLNFKAYLKELEEL